MRTSLLIERKTTVHQTYRRHRHRISKTKPAKSELKWCYTNSVQTKHSAVSMFRLTDPSCANQIHKADDVIIAVEPELFVISL